MRSFFLFLILLLFLQTWEQSTSATNVDPDYARWLKYIDQTSSPVEEQPLRFNDPVEVAILEGNGTDSHRKNLEFSTFGVDADSKSTIKTITVAKDGSGQFKTVQSAVKSIPKSNKQRIIIHIKAGIYKEKVKVNQDWITFLGDGAATTVIQWGDTASKVGNTFKSASVAVDAHHFTARNISFKNTAPPPPGGARGRQAVALRITGDFAAFINVNFYGAQDTLYDQEGRHYFSGCYIEGSIDFIFGNGRSFYYKCRLHSIASPSGSLTAQKRLTTSESTGFSFVKCSVTGSGAIYLGRAWGPASRVVFSLTYFDNIILPRGWHNWNDKGRQKTVFYAEYNCYGPGANRRNRVPWSRSLTEKQARPFLHTGFINGEQWLNAI